MPSAFGLVLWTFFTLWWLTIRHFPYLLLGPAATYLQLTEVWQVTYVPVLVLGLAAMARQWLIIVRPLWLWPHSLLGLMICGIGLVVSWHLLQGYPYVVTWRKAEGWKSFENSAEIANAIIFYWLAFISCPCFIIAGVVHASRCLLLIFEWFRSGSPKTLS